MITVYVVEDEVRILENTLSMLEEMDVQVAGSSKSIDEAYADINKIKPNLVLLDVEVGSDTSFDLLNRFSSIDFKVIFITAHQKYAVDAFRFSAVDFLLKPVSFKALNESIARVKNSIDENQDTLLKTLQHNLQSTLQEQKIILKTQNKIHIHKLEEIIHCESDQSYTIFYTAEEKIVVSKTMGYYDELLTPTDFYRVHKSHLINLKHIRQIHKSDGGEVELSDGCRVPISQRKKEEFLQRVDGLGLQ